MPRMFALLFACAEKPAPVDTGSPAICAGSPEVVITSPTDGARFAIGEQVALAGTATSSVDDTIVLLWAVDGDVEVIGATGTWTPTAAGEVLLRFQAEDRCGITQSDLHVTVTGGDTADTGA